MLASENPSLGSQLRQIIYYSLDNDLIQNALFHAGRLQGLDPRNSDALHLLALCHLRLGQTKAAYDTSREKGVRGQHLGCAYVFAQACLTLERYTEGITALDRSRGFWATRNHWNKHSETSRRHLPDAAAVYSLLGKLWKALGDRNKAAEYLSEALKLNPFLWDAFTELCHTGAKVRTQSVFKPNSEMMAYWSMPAVTAAATPGDLSLQSLPLQPHVNGNINGLATPAHHDPFSSKSRMNGSSAGTILSDSNLASHTNGVPMLPGLIDWETPTANGSHIEEDVMMDEAATATAIATATTTATATASSGNFAGSREAEAPDAPARKPRSLYAFQSETVGDVPKMRSITTRSRTKAGSESGESTETISRPTSIPISHKRTVSGQTAHNGSSSAPEPPGAPQRRSDRLLFKSKLMPSSSSRLGSLVSKDVDGREKREVRRLKAPGTKGKSTISTVGRVVSGNRKAPEPIDRDGKEVRPFSAASTIGSVREGGRRVAMAPHQAAGVPQDQAAMNFLLDQYFKLGSGYQALIHYNCKAALDYFESLSPAMRETPWVLAQIGKAYFEKSSYVEAEQIFAKVKKIAPSRMEDMEVYSTILWHLRKDVDLAYLSHELIEMDRLSPQAWCAIGNSFSLQREHDQAVKCFKRATQLDPKFAYAFTLQGHEHVENEEFDKALMAFRNAIAADNRHYNGWYGLGKVFEKLGKYDIAREHYRNASSINPTNPVLKVCIGVVYEKARQPELALKEYMVACELDPRSTKSRFAKANMLLKLKRPREAFIELDALKNSAPDEANVHYLLGRLFKMLHDKTSAIRHYTIAMNLDPKGTNQIKEALESLEEPETDGEFDDDDMV